VAFLMTNRSALVAGTADWMPEFEATPRDSAAAGGAAGAAPTGAEERCPESLEADGAAAQAVNITKKMILMQIIRLNIISLLSLFLNYYDRY
jgi:hypothetical protein